MPKTTKQFWKLIYEILNTQAQKEQKDLNPPNKNNNQKNSHTLHKTIGQVLGFNKKIYGMEPDIIASFFANLNHQTIDNFDSEQIIYELQRSITYTLIKNAVENLNSVDWKNNLMLNKSASKLNDCGKNVKIEAEPVYFILTGRFFSLPNGRRFVQEMMKIAKDLGMLQTEVDVRFSLSSNGMVGAKGCLMLALSI